MSDIAPEQGRAGLSLPSPINMDWQHPDADAPRPVFLLVYPPSSPRSTHGRAHTWRDLHWSLAWQPSCPETTEAPGASEAGDAWSPATAAGAWRHVQLDTYDVRTDPAPQPRYVFWGARTASADPAALAGVAALQLGSLPRDARKRIEALAWETPVAFPNGRWNCQDWLRALLELVMAEGLVDRARVQEALVRAETSELSLARCNVVCADVVHIVHGTVSLNVEDS